MIGAYYAYQPLQSIHGLGQAPGAAPPPPAPEGSAMEALEQILAMATPIELSPWAAQIGDLNWRELEPTQKYLAWPVNAEQLLAVERAASDPIGYVAVLTQSPVTLVEAEEAFSNTPFELSDAVAVYRQNDPEPIPKMYFLYWGRLRDVATRTGSSLDLGRTADKLGGQLTITMQTVLTGKERHHPTTAFQDALSVQQALAPENEQTLPGALPGDAAPAKIVGRVPWLMVGVGVLGLVVGYQIIKRRKT